MSYQVLARKWRPQNFLDMVGQDHISETLINAIRSGRVGHAYLFVGTRGIGKTTSARIFAKALNCKNLRPDGNPCDECQNCREIIAGSSLDVIEIDGASNNSVDDIRTIRDGVVYAPSNSPYKIYIIDEVHMLTTAAWNALLKTLEEPPSHVKFLFATTEAHKVLPTIISRCQRFDLKRIPQKTIADRLREIVSKEGFSFEESALQAIARSANGGMRDALSITDQMIAFCGSSGRSINEDDVTEVFGMTSTREIHALIKALFEDDAKALLAGVNNLADRGRNLEILFADLLTTMRNIMVVTVTGPDAGVILQMDDASVNSLRQIAANARPGLIQALLDGMLECDGKIRHSLNKRVALELILVRIMRQGHAVQLDDVLKQLNHLRGADLNALDQVPPYTPEKKSLSDFPVAETAAVEEPSIVEAPGLPEVVEEFVEPTLAQEQVVLSEAVEESAFVEASPLTSGAEESVVEEFDSSPLEFAESSLAPSDSAPNGLPENSVSAPSTVVVDEVSADANSFNKPIAEQQAWQEESPVSEVASASLPIEVDMEKLSYSAPLDEPPFDPDPIVESPAVTDAVEVAEESSVPEEERPSLTSEQQAIVEASEFSIPESAYRVNPVETISEPEEVRGFEIAEIPLEMASMATNQEGNKQRQKPYSPVDASRSAEISSFLVESQYLQESKDLLQIGYEKERAFDISLQSSPRDIAAYRPQKVEETVGLADLSSLDVGATVAENDFLEKSFTPAEEAKPKVEVDELATAHKLDRSDFDQAHAVAVPEVDVADSFSSATAAHDNLPDGSFPVPESMADTVRDLDRSDFVQADAVAVPEVDVEEAFSPAVQESLPEESFPVPESLADTIYDQDRPDFSQAHAVAVPEVDVADSFPLEVVESLPAESFPVPDDFSPSDFSSEVPPTLASPNENEVRDSAEPYDVVNTVAIPKQELAPQAEELVPDSLSVETIAIPKQSLPKSAEELTEVNAEEPVFSRLKSAVPIEIASLLEELRVVSLNGSTLCLSYPIDMQGADRLKSGPLHDQLLAAYQTIVPQGTLMLLSASAEKEGGRALSSGQPVWDRVQNSEFVQEVCRDFGGKIIDVRGL